MSAFWGHAASQTAYRHQLEAADAKIENALTAALAHTLGGSLEEAKDAATQLHALIRGLWLNFMLNPRDAAREELASHAISYVDRLSGAPVRIVRDHIIARPAKPEMVKPDLKLKPATKGKKEPAQQQMDIEDLFSRTI